MFRLLRNLFPSRNLGRAAPDRRPTVRRARPNLEALEDRSMPSAVSPSSLLVNYSSGLGLQSGLNSRQLASVSSHGPAQPVLTLGSLPEIPARSCSFGTGANGMFRQVQINMDRGTLPPQLLSQLFAFAAQKQRFAQATLTVPNPAVANGQTQFTFFGVRVTSCQTSSTTCTITLTYNSLKISEVPAAR